MLREIIRKTYWVLSEQLGLDFRRMLRSLRGLPRYMVHWFRFRRIYSGPMEVLPCLHDWYEEGGTTHSEYFWQDLHVARKIHGENPHIHVDIGSRIDGFVAHLATFRNVEVFDIRPVSRMIPGVIFRQADLMSPAETHLNYCDSLSCLHALEHFGLGRYGDPLDPRGYIAGFANMAKLLRPEGVFYLSTPIGIERVAFNAHRVFNPKSLVALAADNGLVLREFAWFGEERILVESNNLTADVDRLAGLRYSLGIFTFVKAEWHP